MSAPSPLLLTIVKAVRCTVHGYRCLQGTCMNGCELTQHDHQCREEDWALGGIMVQDCLDLLSHLLQNNIGNQLMFR